MGDSIMGLTELSTCRLKGFFGLGSAGIRVECSGLEGQGPPPHKIGAFMFRIGFWETIYH